MLGYTLDVKKRFVTHNSGGSIHTRKDWPWELVLCMVFKNIECVKEFE